MKDKPAGWYYVGDGKLRYRDDHDWTDVYMDTSDPRARDWPPPSPSTVLAQLRDSGREAYAESPSRRGRSISTLFHRGRRAR